MELQLRVGGYKKGAQKKQSENVGPCHQKRNDEPLGKIRHSETSWRRPPGRKKKTWAKNVEEDLKKTGVVAEDALDRAGWRVIVNQLPSSRRRKKTLKK